MHLRKIKRKLISDDPQRPTILHRIRFINRHLPINGLFFFFDVQPIAVKAYGGQKWTTAKALVLSKYQKTKGFFYLFLAYEAKTGLVVWAFFRSKASRYVCKFMKQIRHRFPKQQIWIALDQDRPHPCKCRSTRITMRKLKLRWISLPKRSPNDNPVENIFRICKTITWSTLIV